MRGVSLAKLMFLNACELLCELLIIEDLLRGVVRLVRIENDFVRVHLLSDGIAFIIRRLEDISVDLIIKFRNRCFLWVSRAKR